MFALNFTRLRFFTFSIIVLAVALSPAITGIQYRSEITDYFDADDTRVKHFHALEADMGLQQNLLVFLDNETSFLNSEGIDTLYGIHHQLKTLDGVARIDSILTTAVSDAEGNTVSVYNHIRQSKPISDSILGQIADNSESNVTLLSEGNNIASLYLYFDKPEQIKETYLAVQHTLTDHYPGQHYLLGPVQIKQALHEALLHDGFYLMPLVLVLGLGVLWYFLRSYWLVLSGAASIIAALWVTAGIVGTLKLTINQTSSLAFCIAFIIALADVIHLLMSFTHQPANISQTQAMLNSLRSNGASLFLTSLTTGIGFLSLNGSSSPVFATFGNIAAIGVACAFITAVTITPVLAVMLNTQARRTEPDIFQRCIEWINTHRSGFKPTHYRLFYLLSIVCSSAIVLNQYHNDPLDYFQSDSPIIQATTVSEQQFGVHHPISIQIDSGQKEGVFDARFLRTIYELQNWLEAHPRVSNQSNFLAVLSSLKRHLHENNLKWSTAPLNSVAAADLWNLYQMSAPENGPQNIGLDTQFRRATITIGTPKLQSKELLELEKDIAQWLDNHSNFNYAVTGHAMLFASIGKELTTNMFLGGLFSAMIISLLIGLFLGNLKLGLLSLIPNLFPAGVVYGVWAMAVGNIDIAAAGTLSISLGIVVDDSIHILKRYSNFRKSGLLPEQAINQAFNQVGSALMLTTLILCLGLGVLMLSIFGPNQITAFIMSAIILVALLYDLFMLPHLLIKFDGWLFPRQTHQPLDCPSVV